MLKFMKRHYTGLVVVPTFIAYLVSIQMAVNAGLGAIVSTIIGDLMLILGIGVVYIMERRKGYVQPITSVDIRTDYKEDVIRCFQLLVATWFIGQFVFVWAYTSFGDKSYTDNYADLFTNPAEILWIFLLTAFIAPIAEELVFRYLMFGKPIYKKGGPQPLLPKYLFWHVASAVAFGLIHGTVVHLIVVIPLGLVLGMMMYKTNRIVYPIVGHIAFNNMSIWLSSAITEYKSYVEYPVAVGIGLILYVGLLAYIGYFVWKVYKN